MSSIQKHIKDLIFFYIKTNYENYLKINGITHIEEDKIESTISSLYEERKEHLTHKKNELGDILKETEKEENELLKKSKEFESKIDESLIISYKKIRSSVRNGLAVVAVERGASAGSFFTIPPQVQLDIASRKKLITDEHSGRILVDKALADEESVKMEKLFTSF